jgi:hypothetical protein
MIILFGALSGSTAFPAFFLWPPSFSSRVLTFSPAPTFLRPLSYISPATTFSPALKELIKEHSGGLSLSKNFVREELEASELEVP